MLISTSLLVLGGAGATYSALNRRETIAEAAKKLILRAKKIVQSDQQEQGKDATVVTNTLNETERSFNNKFMIAVSSLGCAVGGAALGFPALSALSAVGVIYAGLPMYKRSWQSLVDERRISGYVLTSIITTFTLVQHYFIYAAMQIVLVNVSQQTLLKVKAKSRDGLLDIFCQQPGQAWLVVNDQEIETEVEKLQAGDIIVVYAGETVPVDGVVVQGSGAVDQQMLTGESQPVERESGETVLASTLLLSGKLHIEVEKAGNETSIAKIGEILNQTINTKSESELWVEKLVDKAAAPTLAFSALCVPVLGVAPAIFVLNNYLGPRTVAITSIGMMNYIKLLSDHGILIKDGSAIEALNNVDTVVFDKTGTLTSTQPVIKRIISFGDWDEEEILRFAASVENKQTHPVAQAILAGAHSRELPLHHCEQLEYEVGYGLKAVICEHQVLLGSLRLMRRKNILIDPAWETEIQSSMAQGNSIIMLALNDKPVGMIELAPVVHPAVKSLIAELKQCHVSETYVISGDQKAPTEFLANELGIDHYHAEVLPQDKAALIRELQDAGHTVCFVGDGINDAIALKQADVSISLSGATSIATDTAQIILMDGTVCQLGQLFNLAKDFRRAFKQIIAVSVVPSLMGVAGVFSLNFGLWGTFLTNQLNLAAIPIVMQPLAKAKQLRIEKQRQEKVLKDNSGN